MAADKKPQIVIKKITVVAGGGHGGAWKVAFADFMTAMMAFFLVMWLISSASEEEKKAISDYFSTPSVIEYQFQNFGAELTLEKLFLDLVNEPIKTLETIMQPQDHAPNVMHLGGKKIMMAYMAEQLGTVASDVSVTADSVVFEIPDNLLFRVGSTDPGLQFVQVMDRIRGVTEGLEDSDVIITSMVYREFVQSKDMVAAQRVSEQRLDILLDKVKSTLKHENVLLSGTALAKDDDRGPHDTRPGGGYVRFEIRQKSVKPESSSKKASETAASDKAEYDEVLKDVQARDAKREKPLPIKKEEYWDGHKKRGLFGAGSKKPASVESTATAADVTAEAQSAFPKRSKQDD